MSDGETRGVVGAGVPATSALLDLDPFGAPKTTLSTALTEPREGQGVNSLPVGNIAAARRNPIADGHVRVWRTIRAMKTTRQLTAIIEREDDAYVALCPELDVASQGDTVESARKNLIEALELFFESADPTEVARRLHGEVFVTRIEVLVG
jgi:predicted RNase H-like HicB family nuclease